MSGSDARDNVVIFGCGPRGSGKTRLMWTRYTSRAPRVLTLDTLGEAAELDKRAICTYGLEDTLRCLRHCASYSHWHIAAALNDPAELGELLEILAPPFSRPDVVGYSRAVGGMVLESTEIDVWAPNQGADRRIISAWRRGRHHALSIYAATQRPASCSRDVTAQADILFSFAHHEPAEREFLARAISRAVADRVAELPKYHHAIYVKEEQYVYWCGADGAPYLVTDPRGEELARASRSRPSTSPRRAGDARRMA